MANELGLRSVAFEVDDLQAAVDRLTADGYGLVGDIMSAAVEPASATCGVCKSVDRHPYRPLSRVKAPLPAHARRLGHRVGSASLTSHRRSGTCVRRASAVTRAQPNVSATAR